MKIRSFNGEKNKKKHAFLFVSSQNDVISMTCKLKSETSSQKIDVSADIIFGSLTLQNDFVILVLNVICFRNVFLLQTVNKCTTCEQQGL